MIPFGSNFTYLDTANTQGFVYTYNQNRDAAKKIFAQCAAAGQTCARIPLYHWAAEENYIPDGFNLGLYGSMLDGQRVTNLQNMLADLKSAGFTYAEVGFGPAGMTLSPYNWGSPIGDKWEREANFIWALRPMVQAVGFQQYALDFGEFLKDPATLVGQYAQTLWTWYTTALGSQPKDAHFGITEDPGDCANLPIICRGLDPNGQPNYFPQLQLHAYGNSLTWRCAYATVCGLLSALVAAGVPKTIPVSIGETYSFQDLTTLAEITRAVQDSPGWTFARIMQWSTTRTAVMQDSGIGNPPVMGIPRYLNT